MKDNEKLIPKRRFREFINDGAWERRELGNLVDVTTGKLDANAMVEDGEFDFYTSGIKKYRIDIPAFEGPAITIAGNGATVGYMHLADGKFNAYQRTYVLTGFRADRNFLFSETGKKLPRKIAEEARTGNIPYIVMDMLTELIINMPSNLDEQKQVGQFFTNLDNLITLHQRKLEKVKNLKSAYLSKMFPKEGEKYPELRFAGFTNAWGQRKLGELYDSVESGNRLPKNMLNEGAIPYVIAKTTNNGILMRIDEDTRDYHGNKMKMFYDGSITFSIDNPEAIFLQHEPFYTSNIMRVLYNREYNSSHSTFILESLKKLTENYNWSLKFSGPVVMSSFISLPVNRCGKVNWIEVEAIGQLIKSLDNLITLHQRKLDKLKNIKKAYLNEMFV